MPASEFAGWQAYFSIYPFTVDRQDIAAARVAERITNMIGAQAAGRKWSAVPLDDFLPNYLGTPKQKAEKSLQQQTAEFAAFHSKLKSVTPSK